MHELKHIPSDSVLLMLHVNYEFKQTLIHPKMFFWKTSVKTFELYMNQLPLRILAVIVAFWRIFKQLKNNFGL